MQKRLTSVHVILERFIEYLDLGLVFGNYEADEGTSSAVDFQSTNHKEKTPCILVGL